MYLSPFWIGVVEDRRAGVAAVQHVEDRSAGGDARAAGHGTEDSRSRRQRQDICTYPLFGLASSKIGARALPRFSTWKTVPPGAMRGPRGMGRRVADRGGRVKID